MTWIWDYDGVDFVIDPLDEVSGLLYGFVKGIVISEAYIVI